MQCHTLCSHGANFCNPTIVAVHVAKTKFFILLHKPPGTDQGICKAFASDQLV